MNNISVMIIDDEYTDRYILKRILKNSNLVNDIIEAENGQEALDILLSNQNIIPINNDHLLIIFLDINMHVMNGFEFLEHFSKLREENKIFQTTIFTMLTSSEREEDKKKINSYDFVKGFIIKGDFNELVFTELINKHIKK